MFFFFIQRAFSMLYKSIGESMRYVICPPRKSHAFCVGLQWLKGNLVWYDSSRNI